MISRPPVLVRRDDGFDVSLSDEERALLRSIPSRLQGALEALIDANVPVPHELRRLFPVAFTTDQEAEKAYELKMRAALVEHHRHALNVLSETASATHLVDADVENWLAAVNDLRLVIGSILDVSEEPSVPDDDDPNYADWLYYQYLTYLESEVVDAIASLLPPATPDADESVPDDPWGEPPGGLRWDGTPIPKDL